MAAASVTFDWVKGTRIESPIPKSALNRLSRIPKVRTTKKPPHPNPHPPPARLRRLGRFLSPASIQRHQTSRRPPAGELGGSGGSPGRQWRLSGPGTNHWIPADERGAGSSDLRPRRAGRCAHPRRPAGEGAPSAAHDLLYGGRDRD